MNINTQSFPVAATTRTVNLGKVEGVIATTKEEFSAYTKQREEWNELPLYTWKEYQNLPSDWQQLTPEQSFRSNKYRDSEQFIMDLTKMSMEQGADQDAQYIVKVGDDYIKLDYKGGSTSPNKYARYISDEGHDQTLKNLYEAFGKNNVTVEKFDPGEGPTNAQAFEIMYDKDYFEHLRESLKMSLALHRETHDSTTKNKINVVVT